MRETEGVSGRDKYKYKNGINWNSQRRKNELAFTKKKEGNDMHSYEYSKIKKKCSSSSTYVLVTSAVT